MITVFLLIAAFASGALARKALRRGWRLHAVASGAGSLILAVVAVLHVAFGVDDIPGWLLAALAVADVLFVAVAVDVGRLERHAKKAAQ